MTSLLSLTSFGNIVLLCLCCLWFRLILILTCLCLFIKFILIICTVHFSLILLAQKSSTIVVFFILFLFLLQAQQHFHVISFIGVYEPDGQYGQSHILAFAITDNDMFIILSSSQTANCLMYLPLSSTSSLGRASPSPIFLLQAQLSSISLTRLHSYLAG